MPVKIPPAWKIVLILDALAIRAPPRQHVDEIDRTKRLVCLYLGVSTEQDAIEHLVQNRRTSNVEDRKRRWQTK